MKIKRICEICGKEFESHPSEIKKGWAKYCSRLCRSIAQSKLYRGENNSQWKGGRIKCVCLVCSKEFDVSSFGKKRGRGKFCSKKCMGIAQSKNRIGENSACWKGGKIKCACLICGKEFERVPSSIENGRGKYCSKKCQGIALAKNNCGENNPSWKGGPAKRKCQQCGKTFYTKPSEIKNGNGKFCSRSCARKQRSFSTHHTKPELIFEEICKKNNLPFHSVADSKVWIGKSPSLNPDFVECNGKKIAIFVNGDYWHSPLLRYNLKESQRADVQVKICKRHRWVPIIIWETDLLRKDAEAFVLNEISKHL